MDRRRIIEIARHVAEGDDEGDEAEGDRQRQQQPPQARLARRGGECGGRRRRAVSGAPGLTHAPFLGRPAR